VISVVQLLHAYVDMIVMALLELRQELYNESGVCESTPNALHVEPSGLGSLFEDEQLRHLSANVASASANPASVTGPVSRVNTITKYATDIVLFEQRLALVCFLLRSPINIL
jgi:hypothetical protein